MEADDVDRARVEANRRAREEAGAARQPRAGGCEDFPVGETTTGDNDADVGRAADDIAPLTQGAGSNRPGSRRQQQQQHEDPRPEVPVAPPRE